MKSVFALVIALLAMLTVSGQERPSTEEKGVVDFIPATARGGFAAKVFFFVREADYVTIAQRFSAGRSRKTVESP